MFLNAERVHQRHERHRRHLPARPSPSSARSRALNAVRRTTSSWSCIDHDHDDPRSTGSRIPGSGGPGRRSARTSWRRRPTASTPSRRSCSRSRSARRPPGFAGVFNASKLTIVSPDQFLFTVSFTVLAMVVLGGMGNIWGVAVGAFIIYIDPERPAQAAQQRSSTTIPGADPRRTSTSSSTSSCCTASRWSLMMLLRPEGLFPSQRRRARAARRPTTRATAASRSRRPDPSGHRRGAMRPSATGLPRTPSPTAAPTPEVLLARAAASRKRFGGLRRRQRRSTSTIPRGLDRQPHRAERRRQDDVLQHHRRHLRPDRRARSTSGATHDRPAASERGSSRSCGSCRPRSSAC